MYFNKGQYTFFSIPKYFYKYFFNFKDQNKKNIQFPKKIL